MLSVLVSEHVKCFHAVPWEFYELPEFPYPEHIRQQYKHKQTPPAAAIQQYLQVLIYPNTGYIIILIMPQICSQRLSKQVFLPRPQICHKLLDEAMKMNKATWVTFLRVQIYVETCGLDEHICFNSRVTALDRPKGVIRQKALLPLWKIFPFSEEPNEKPLLLVITA